MADSTRDDGASPEDRRAVSADGSWMLSTATGIVGIWVAVVLISVFAPDFVSGSEQEPADGRVHDLVLGRGRHARLPVGDGKLRGNATWRPTWIGLAIVTLVVWAAATIIGIATPVFETGSDPTQIPFGAFFAPVAAAMLTALAGVVTNVFRRGLGQG